MSRRNISSGYAFEESYGYSRAVRVGDLIFVSGTTARGDALGSDAYQQARAILELIEAALVETGAALHHVVRTVVYVIDLKDQEAVAKAHREVFADIRPASSLVQVAALTPAAARVEIEVTAVAN